MSDWVSKNSVRLLINNGQATWRRSRLVRSPEGVSPVSVTFRLRTLLLSKRMPSSELEMPAATVIQSTVASPVRPA